jgi:hypothetical protein
MTYRPSARIDVTSSGLQHQLAFQTRCLRVRTEIVKEIEVSPYRAPSLYGPTHQGAPARTPEKPLGRLDVKRCYIPRRTSVTAPWRPGIHWRSSLVRFCILSILLKSRLEDNGEISGQPLSIGSSARVRSALRARARVWRVRLRSDYCADQRTIEPKRGRSA